MYSLSKNSLVDVILSSVFNIFYKIFDKSFFSLKVEAMQQNVSTLLMQCYVVRVVNVLASSWIFSCMWWMKAEGSQFLLSITVLGHELGGLWWWQWW